MLDILYEDSVPDKKPRSNMSDVDIQDDDYDLDIDENLQDEIIQPRDIDIHIKQ